MRKRLVRLAAWTVLAVVVVAFIAGGMAYWRARQIREALYAALTPIQITNCTLQRFGDANDGGYLMCANFMGAAEAAYSYGIDGRDRWGCEVGAAAGIPVHQYDCFNTTEPACEGAATIFHAECVGPERATTGGRPFDTLSNQIEANRHTGRRIILKMDVEGSEWRSLATAPEHVLNAIDQMSVEFHGVEDAQFLDTAAHLRDFFYVAHVHQNNYECRSGYDPFTGPVFEVLFVNKRIAVADPWLPPPGPSPLDAPNWTESPDCQGRTTGSEMQRLTRWTSRQTQRAIDAIRRSLAD